jgi:hypothetical protein
MKKSRSKFLKIVDEKHDINFHWPNLSSLYVCMAIKHIIVLFVETPRKFITAVINLRGVSTNKTIILLQLVDKLAKSLFQNTYC